MSGIEVAGLVLGAIPILIEAIDTYKDGIRKSKTFFRKRKYVDKLAHALILQRGILTETVKSILFESGCKDVWLQLDDDPRGFMDNKRVQAQVLDYMGFENHQAFRGALDQSNEIIKKIAGGMAELIPTFKSSTDDLLGIITANREAPPKQLDLIPRVKLMFGFIDLNEFVQELGRTTDSLSNFSRIVLANRQNFGGTLSRKATNLAKGLRQIRDFASRLHCALCQGWKAGCHSEHEAKLFLEDRVDTAPDILRNIMQQRPGPTISFKLIFAAGTRDEMWWHENAVQVYNDGDDCSGTMSNKPSTVKIIVPLSPALATPKATFVGDICGAIEATKHTQQYGCFILTEQQRVGMINTDKKTCTTHGKTKTTSLEAIFHSATQLPRAGPCVSWKSRMLLALTVSSSLLQLLQTQWLRTPWSKDTICFPTQQRSSVQNGSTDQQHIEIDRPFVSLAFGSANQSIHQPKTEPKVALLELGILLLEIWHEIPLETRFSLAVAPVRYYDRLVLALEWCDDTNNPLLELYDSAVSYCIRGSHNSEWDDMKFWGDVCGNVIEPLQRNCKQWR